MPRRAVPENAETKALREVDAEDTAAITRLALEAGPPADSEKMSEADEDRIYAIEDRVVSADPDGFAQRLMTMGIDQQTLSTLRVLKEHPEWAPTYGAPTQDAEIADQWTRMAQFPFRWLLFKDIPEFTEQCRKAEQLNRRYQKAHAEKVAISEQPMAAVPDPAALPPTMPVEQPDMMPIAAPPQASEGMV